VRRVDGGVGLAGGSVGMWVAGGPDRAGSMASITIIFENFDIECLFWRYSTPSESIKVKVEVIHLTQRCLVKKLPYRSAQVWHALSRNFTVLPVHPRE